MKITITQPEIADILRDHVLKTVQLKDSSQLKIDFTATRGEDGIVASIDIPYVGVTSLDLDAPPRDVPKAAEPPPAKEAKPRATKQEALAAALQTQAAQELLAEERMFEEMPTAAPITGGIFGEAKAAADAAVAPVGEAGNTAPAGTTSEAAAKPAGGSLFP